MSFAAFNTDVPAAGNAGFTFSCADAAHNRAYEKARAVIERDTVNGEFIAGKNWDQVWTRDTSYSVDLGLGLLEPATCQTTLLAQKEQVPGFGECWLQDKCGHFDGWPNLTDAIVGATASWSLYLVTGDRDFLRQTHERTVRSLARAESGAFDQKIGLFGGCSSFMESNSGYPGDYANKGARVARTKALSTNLLYQHGYAVAALAAKVLRADGSVFADRAARLKQVINTRFWNPARHGYVYILDADGRQSERSEGLGTALAILFEVADPARAAEVLDHTPTTAQGFPCLWPQFAQWMDYNGGSAQYYHNGMIWPFVQGYWGWAAARSKNLPRFEREFAALLRLSEKNDTFMEFYRPEDGLPDGSPDQLWSATGYLSMIYHGICGMKFQEDHIEFAPVVPAGLSPISLSRVAYRNNVLDVTVTGEGTRVASFKVDGVARPTPVFSAAAPGAHRVEIEMHE